MWIPAFTCLAALGNRLIVLDKVLLATVVRVSPAEEALSAESESKA
jgi:hypothetical protein